MKRTTAQNIIRIIRRAGTIAAGLCTIVVASAILTANDLMTSSQSLRVTCETNTSISVAVGDNFSDRFSASGTYTLDKLTFEITDGVFFETV